MGQGCRKIIVNFLLFSFCVATFGVLFLHTGYGVLMGGLRPTYVVGCGLWNAPGWRWNPQHLVYRTSLQPREPPGQGPDS